MGKTKQVVKAFVPKPKKKRRNMPEGKKHSKKGGK
jgi:hypothetical protein